MNEERVRDWHSRRVPPAATLHCAECGRASDEPATGWHARRLDEPGAGETPQLAFLCPPCGGLVSRVG